MMLHDTMPASEMFDKSFILHVRYGRSFANPPQLGWYLIVKVMSHELGRLTFEMVENSKCIPGLRLSEVTHFSVK